MSTSRIAICLYKEELKKFAYPDFFAGTLTPITLNGKLKDVHLFQRGSKENTPPWVEIIKKFSRAKEDDLKTSSSGAILILKAKGRYFGCCFGTSVANVNREHLVSDFGLAATFKRMAQSSTKSIESFTFSGNPITSQRTSSIPTSRNNFNIDTLGENITELQGIYSEGKRRFLVKGKEFFSCPAIDSLDALIKLCEQLLLDYQNTIAHKEFSRLTATKKIKDRKLIEQLDKDLCKKFSKGDKSLHLSDYENLAELASYKLPNTKVVTDLIVTDLDRPKKKATDVAFLKEKKIVPLNADGTELSSWSLYKTLFIEIDSKYILYKGAWYEIDPSFVTSLKGFLDNFHVDLEASFPKWNGKDPEGLYNSKAATSLGGQLWDKKLFVHPDYNYGVELADIITKDRIISVKAYKGSSLNSHLLLQTLVAVQLLEDNGAIYPWIQQLCNDKFGGKNFIGSTVDDFRANKLQVVILLLSDQKKRASEILPFFSLISFKMILTRIQTMGFEVKVAVA